MTRTCSLLLVLLAGCVRLEEIGLPHRVAAERLDAIDTLNLRQRLLANEDATGPSRAPSGRSRTAASKPAERGATENLALGDLRQRVLRENLGLRVQLFEPEIAAARIGVEEGRFDATLFGGVRYKRAELPEGDSDLVSFTSDNKDLDKQVVKLTNIRQTKEDIAGEAGVEVPLTTGGKLKVAQTFDQNKKVAPQPSEQYLSGLKFSLSQPLLRGAGAAVNLAGIRIAGYRHQATRARTKLAATRLLADAEKAYWRVYAAERILDVRQQQFDLAAENLRLVQRRVDEGLSAAIEVTRAEVGVAERREALIVAETGLRIQQRGLAVTLNEDEAGFSAPPAYEAGTEPTLLAFELDRASLERTALRQRMDLLDLELKVAEEALRVDVARNQTLPLIALDFEYGLISRSGSLASAWSGMWDFDESTWSVGLRGELPVTNQARLSEFRAALLRRAQQMATLEQRRQAVLQDVHNAADLLDQNWQRILAARKNVAVAGVNYEAEQKQFAAGTRTMREVLEALAQLGEAQLREVRAIVEYQVAQIDLAFATGTVLDYAGVRVEVPAARLGGRKG